jgi:hypothetical protein
MLHLPSNLSQRREGTKKLISRKNAKSKSNDYVVETQDFASPVKSLAKARRRKEVNLSQKRKNAKTLKVNQMTMS